MRGIAVLGSTGSIGLNTLDVVARHPDRFKVVALAANQDAEGIAEQCRRFEPSYAVMADPAAAARLRPLVADLRHQPEVLEGPESLDLVAALPEVDDVMAAIVGAAGLRSTLAAARAGKRLLLANKEALVMSGALLMQAVAESGGTLLPIDSEHNAVFQCLPGGHTGRLADVGVTRILLTASGGPFRETPRELLRNVTPEQACNHPNWSMGRKISVDSATMMNKGLELIEACWLFAATADQVQVVIHPQSVIHSLVQYVDGSVLAQLGNPDMRTPIAHALAWPERLSSGVADLDLFAIAHLDFQAPDLNRFPCLTLAYRAAEAGGIAPTVLNAANEVAVAAFLNGRIRFLDIAMVVEDALSAMAARRTIPDSIEALLEVDREVRMIAERSISIV